MAMRRADLRLGLLFLAVLLTDILVQTTFAQLVPEAVDCSPCPSGSFLEQECHEWNGESRICSPCTACPKKHYLKSACSETSDSVCKSCSKCKEDEDKISECTEFEDTKCSSKEKKKDKIKDSGADLTVMSDPEANGVDCECPEGKYVSRECDIEKGKDRECSSCKEFCGDDVKECRMSDSNQVECKQCNFDSNYPVYISDEDGDGFGPCTFCTPCNDNQYLKEPCSGTQNNVCKNCSTCGDNEVLKSECTATSDTECEPNDAEGGEEKGSVDCSDCEDGYFLSKECDEESGEDRGCSPCSGICGEGMNDCFNDSDEGVLCKECAPGKQLSEASDGGYGKCETIQSEDAEQVPEDAAAEAVEGSIDCGPCPDGEYVYRECLPDEGKERKCAPCSDVCGEDVTECKAVDYKEAHCKQCGFKEPHFLDNADDDGYGECKPCSSCDEGEFLETPCFGTTDSICKACSECDDGEELEEECSENADTKCRSKDGSADDDDKAPDGESVDCSECPTGMFLTEECNKEQGISRKCVSCEDICGTGNDACLPDGNGSALCKACSDGKTFEPSSLVYGFGSCLGGDSDSVQCGECPDGEFVSKECDSDAGQDRECKPCSDRCGDGIKECVAVGDGEAHCKECNFDNELPLYISDRDGDGWGECKFCSPCQEGEYLQTPCSGTEDNICQKCSECVDAEIEEACGATQDTKCKITEGTAEDDSGKEDESSKEEEVPTGPCRPCNDGEFVSKECDTDADEERECKPCSDRCGEGVMECVATGDGDAHCKECKFDTDLPMYVEDRDGDGWGECKFCSACGEGQYQAVPCSGTEDNVCRDCRVCEDGEVLEQCTETKDTRCSGDLPEENEPNPPKAIANINAAGELEVTFSLDSEDFSFDDFFIVYKYEETTDADNVRKPDCDDDGTSSTGGSVEDTDDAPLILDPKMSWGFAIATCPKRNTEGFKNSNTARVVLTGCGCQEGEYEMVPCTEGQLAICEKCDKCGEGGLCKGPNFDDCTKCGEDNFYLDVSGTTDVGPCRRCREECATDEFMVSKCTETTDMVCERCSPACEDDEVEVQACSKISDRICISSDIALAPMPVIDSSRTRYGEDGRLYMYLTLPEPLSFDDFYIAYAWTASSSLMDALPALCGEDDSEVVNVIEEEQELRRDEDWIVLSAITCPKPGVAAHESLVYRETFSACYCQEGFFAKSPCEAGENLVECSPCTECADGEEESVPCQGLRETGGDRQCVAPEGSYCASSTLGGECTECKTGFYLSEGDCVTCTTCGEEEIIERSCSPAADGHDTICKSTPANVTLVPDVSVQAVGKWGLQNNKPHMRLSVSLAQGMSSGKYVTRHEVEVAESYEQAQELSEIMDDPSCDGEGEIAQPTVNELRGNGGGYAWLVVKAVTCPRWKSQGAPESNVSTTFISACSCPPGEMPASSCNLLEGSTVVCEACPDDGCPEILAPPVVVSNDVIAPEGSKLGTVRLYSEPGSVLAYTNNADADGESPCDTSNEDWQRSSEPVLSLDLPARETTILQAVACPADSAAEGALSYVLTTAVTVTPSFNQDLTSDDAVVNTKSVIEIDLDQFRGEFPEAALLDIVGQEWSRSVESLFADNGTNVKVVVTGVTDASPGAHTKRRRTLQASSRLQLQYTVQTTAEKARAVELLLEKRLMDGELPEPFEDAKAVSHSADIKCSLEHSRPCQIEWWGGTDSRCLPDVLPGIDCGRLVEGIILERPGVCGPPCDDSCVSTGSCTQIEPCPECECGLGCNLGSGIAVSRQGPDQKDKLSTGSTESVEALSNDGEGGSTPAAQQWWIWVIVVVVVVGILAAVSFAFLVRRRRSMNGRPSSQGSDSNPNFVFSSVYEEPRDSGRDANMIGDSKGRSNHMSNGGIGESQVHVHTNGRGAFGMEVDGSRSSDMSDHFRNDLI